MLKQRLLMAASNNTTATTLLYSWGSSVSYATGQNTTSTITTPTTVGGPSPWLKVVSFGGNTVGYGGFAIKSNGTLWSWGDSSNYGTGQGTLTNIQIPTQIGTDTDWTDVIGTGGGGFALKSNGTLWSWGESNNYQTGQNTTTNIQVPTQVGTDTNWAKITAFAQGGFAIKTNGTLWSWGWTISYATGQGSISTFQVPTQMGTDTDWADVSGMAYGGLAIKTNRTIYSWGASNDYATGQATLTDIQVPTQIGTGTDWLQVAGCSYTGFALKSNGTLWSWGDASFYQTGQNTTTNSQTPTQIGVASDWAVVYGGFNSSTGYAVKSNGIGYSWGNSANYQGGNGGTASIQVPTIISGATNWGSFSASTSAFAITDMTPPVYGSLFGWGNNINGQTAQNTLTGATLAPARVPGIINDWVKIVLSRTYPGATIASGAGALGLRSNGTLWAWGNNSVASLAGTIAQGNNFNKYSVPIQIGVLTTWADIAQNENGGLAIKTDGTLWSWGTDLNGSLGHGGLSAVNYTPAQVGVATTWSKVFTSTAATFLIDTTGRLWTIGSNTNYVTGLGTNLGDTTTITQIGSATNWLFVSSGLHGTIGIRTDGTLWTWGADQAGELAQGSVGGTYTTPTQVGALTTWATATYGADQSGTPWAMYIKTDGTLWAAGSNSTYQTGLGTNAGNTTTLTQVGAATNWESIVCMNINAGNLGGCVGLRTDGTLWSWGSNNQGQTGQGTVSGNTTSPTQIGTSTAWVSLAIGCSGINGPNFCMALA